MYEGINVGSDIASKILKVTQPTITRKCRNHHAFPNATQDGQGQPWHIPVTDIIAYCQKYNISMDNLDELLKDI